MTEELEHDGPEATETTETKEAKIRDDKGKFTKAEEKVEERDLQLDVSMSERRVVELTNELNALRDSGSHNASKLSELTVQLGSEITKRSAIEKQAAEQKTKLLSQMDALSQATQTLTTEKESAASRAAQAEAKATKYEVMTTEFPELLGYLSLIPEDANPETVREAAVRLKAAREKDLEGIRVSSVTGSQKPIAPARTDPVVDAKNMEKYLAEAMHDPIEFARRDALIRAQLEGSARN